MLNELNSITEWIFGKQAHHSGNLLGVALHGETLLAQRLCKARKIINDKARVCFLCGTKGFLYAEMHLQSATTKPNPTSSCEIWRLWNLFQPKHSRVESSSRLLLPPRHSELHVVDGKNSGHCRLNVFQTPPARR